MVAEGNFQKNAKCEKYAIQMAIFNSSKLCDDINPTFLDGSK